MCPEAGGEWIKPAIERYKVSGAVKAKSGPSPQWPPNPSLSRLINPPKSEGTTALWVFSHGLGARENKDRKSLIQ